MQPIYVGSHKGDDLRRISSRRFPLGAWTGHSGRCGSHHAFNPIGCLGDASRSHHRLLQTFGLAAVLGLREDAVDRVAQALHGKPSKRQSLARSGPDDPSGNAELIIRNRYHYERNAFEQRFLYGIEASMGDEEARPLQKLHLWSVVHHQGITGQLSDFLATGPPPSEMTSCTGNVAQASAITWKIQNCRFCNVPIDA